MTRGNRRNSPPPPPRPTRKCPICGRPAARETYPFCSKRCADIDLNRWLSGSYVIPSPEEEISKEDREE
jgi:endogenous inhibitor of DNA gyrase (YacG/DUF329 family)